MGKCSAQVCNMQIKYVGHNGPRHEMDQQFKGVDANEGNSRIRIAKGSNVLLVKAAQHTFRSNLSSVNPYNWKRQSREGIYGWAIWMDLRVPQFGFLESGSMKISFSGAEIHSHKEQMVIVSVMTKAHLGFGDPLIYWSFCNWALIVQNVLISSTKV